MSNRLLYNVKERLSSKTKEEMYMNDVVTYPTILHRLMAEMEALTPEQIAAAEPNTPVARSEKEVAPLSEPLKALYVLWSQKIDQLSELVKQHQAEHDAATEEAPVNPEAPEHASLHEQIKRLDQETDILKVVFWSSVRENYELDSESSSTGLRAGWQVVDMYGTGHSSAITRLLDRIFG